MDSKNERATAVVDPAQDGRAVTDEAGRAAEDRAVIERLQVRNAEVDPVEVLADATAAVEEVRQEVYAERQAQRRR